MKYGVGIIGCGLMGNKRAAALEKFPDSQIVKYEGGKNGNIFGHW